MVKWPMKLVVYIKSFGMCISLATFISSYLFQQLAATLYRMSLCILQQYYHKCIYRTIIAIHKHYLVHIDYVRFERQKLGSCAPDM